MNLNKLIAQPFTVAYDNSIDPLIPENWANEGLAILEENMVVANLVYRDFDKDVAKYGQIVHTRRPGELKGYRKTSADSVSVQDVTATDVEVRLDQWLHCSFNIKDGEETYSFKDLITMYLRPGMLGIARTVDRCILATYAQFLSNYAGGLGQLTGSNARDYILDTRGVMNVNKAYEEDRKLILGSISETTMLKTDLFTAAEKMGDGGNALRTARLGNKLGFETHLSQNMASITVGNTVKTGAVNLSAGYAAGTTNMTVDGFVGAVATGSWMTVGGDDTPLRISGHGETSSNTTYILVQGGLKRAVANDAVIKAYTPGAVNNSGGYASGYAKYITVSGFSVAPQIGQMVSFTTSPTSAVYVIVDVVGSTSIMLDRALESAISDTDAVNIGPAGSYNLAFHPNAIALVNRPLVQPRSGAGALSAVMDYNGVALRCTIQYQGSSQGHLVTLDTLFGVKVLDTGLGAVLLG